MASEKRIVIELRLTDGDGGNGQNGRDGNDGRDGDVHDETTNLKTILHPIKSAEMALLGKSVLLNQAYGYAKQAIKQSVTYGINQHLNLTENYMAQNNMNNAMTTINKVGSLASAMGTGFMLGNVAGLAIATAGWVANEGIQVWQRFDQANIQLYEGNAQSNFQRTRLGLTDGGRGTQN